MLREWFGFTNVLFRAVVALYHVNDVLRVTVHVMSYIRCDEWSDFTCRVECVCLSLTLSLYVRPWRRKAVPSEILVTKKKKDIFPTVKSTLLILFNISTYSWVDPLLGCSFFFFCNVGLCFQNWNYKEQTPTEGGELVQNCSTPP